METNSTNALHSIHTKLICIEPVRSTMTYGAHVVLQAEAMTAQRRAGTKPYDPT